jgi:hypothetical protein
MINYHNKLIKLLKKPIIIAFILFLTTNCGFHSIYSKKSEIQNNIFLPSIKITKYNKKTEQTLRMELEELLNPEHIDIDKKYILNFDLKKQTQITIITDTGSSGRNRMTIKASYILKDIDNDNIISKSSVQAKDSYDVQDNRFANYIAEEKVEHGLLKSISQNIRDLLIRDLNKYGNN